MLSAKNLKISEKKEFFSKAVFVRSLYCTVSYSLRRTCIMEKDKNVKYCKTPMFIFMFHFIFWLMPYGCNLMMVSSEEPPYIYLHNILVIQTNTDKSEIYIMLRYINFLIKYKNFPS